MTWPIRFAQPAQPASPPGPTASLPAPAPAAPVQAFQTRATQLGTAENPVVLPPLSKAPSAPRPAPTPPAGPAPDLRSAIAAAQHSSIMLNAFIGPTASSDSVSQGAATVIEPGFAVTSNHVVEGASAVLYAATNENGEHVLRQAKVIGRAPSLDIALLQLEDESIPAAEMSTTPPRLGDPMVVVGSPWGEQWSATPGYVTGLHRTLDGQPICDCVQVNGGINLGDSGGGAFDSEGRMSGMAEAVFEGKNSMGFVIPVDTLRRVIGRLHQGDVAPRPFGLALLSVDMPWAAAHHTRALDGALVTGFVGPAATSGLRMDDRIVAVNGKRVLTPADASVEIELAPEGQPLSFVVDRGGVMTTIRTIR